MNSTRARSRPVRTATWLVAATVALSGAACGDGDTAEQRSADPNQVASIDTTVEPGSADDGFVGALADVSGMECSAEGSGWAASGQVTNPTDGPVDYRIYVSFVDPEGQTRGLIQVDVVDVAAGEQEAWTTQMGIEADDLRCLLRVERVDASAAGEDGADDAPSAEG